MKTQTLFLIVLSLFLIGCSTYSYPTMLTEGSNIDLTPDKIMSVGSVSLVSNPIINNLTSNNINVTSIKIGPTNGTPSCDSSARGSFFYSQGGNGVSDSLSLCIKTDADDYQLKAVNLI